MYQCFIMRVFLIKECVADCLKQVRNQVLMSKTSGRYKVSPAGQEGEAVHGLNADVPFRQVNGLCLAAPLSHFGGKGRYCLFVLNMIHGVICEHLIFTVVDRLHAICFSCYLPDCGPNTLTEGS